MERLHSRMLLRVLGGLVAVGLLGACGDSADDSVQGVDSGDQTTSAAASQSCTAEHEGGTATFAMFAETRGLDPMVIAGSGVGGGIETAAIFDRLMRYDPDTGRWEPWVAESLEPNENRTSWTLRLRDGVRFGNGDPLTATAVMSSIERMQSDQNKTASRSLAGRVGEMTVVDDLTLRFVLPEPFPSFPGILSDEVGMIVNPAVVEAMSPEQFNSNPSGAGVGPYEPVRFNPGEDLILQAKDDYWRGPVCIEELRFRALQGAPLTYEAFRTGDVDLALLRDPKILEQALDDGVGGSAAALVNMGDVLLINAGGRGADLPTADVRVRQAIAHALDLELLDQRLGTGSAPASQSLASSSSLYSTEGLEGPQYDPELARRLLDEVKAERNWDGSISYICDQSQEDAVLTIAAMLDSVGFKTNVNSKLAVADRIARVRVDGNFELSCWGLGWRDDEIALRVPQNLLSTAAPAHGYTSPDIDRLMTSLTQSATVEDRKDILVELQELWNDEVPSVVIRAVPETVIWNDTIHGITPTSKGVVLFSDAYVD